MATLLDIVIPVYNEGRNIRKNLMRLDDAVKRLQGSPNRVEATLVYDFDEDDTLPAVRPVIDGFSFPIRFLKNERGGVANAIKKGIGDSRGDYVLVTMADLSDDYEVLPRMVEIMGDGCDIVCGSRYMPGGRSYGGPFFKKALSRLAGLSLHSLAGIPTRDITNNFKLYRRSIFEGIDIESEGGFEIAMEITAKTYLNGGRIAEIPTRWWDRTEGESKFRLMEWLPKYLRWYFHLLRKSRL